MFQFPLTNISVTSRFIIYDPLEEKTMHYGMDCACGIGTPVYAANSGTVVMSEWDSGGGNMIAIQGEHELSRYAHLSDRKVQTGYIVNRGDLIGYSGNTGSQTTGAHLHFETWLIPLNYSYNFKDRPKYAVDPMCVCHLLDGQTFNNRGLTTCAPIPYPEPRFEGAKPIKGTLSVINGDVRFRLIPETKKYQYIVGGYNRESGIFGDFFETGDYEAIYTIENEGFTWALINTILGQFWLACVVGKTTLVIDSGNEEIPSEPIEAEPEADEPSITENTKEKTFKDILIEFLQMLLSALCKQVNKEQSN